MMKSSFCDYSDAYIRVSGTITIDGAGGNDNAKQLDERNKGVYLKIVHHSLHKWNKQYSNRKLEI